MATIHHQPALNFHVTVACESMRPRKSIDPLEVHRTKSPVRYKRGAAPWRQRRNNEALGKQWCKKTMLQLCSKDTNIYQASVV